MAQTVLLAVGQQDEARLDEFIDTAASVVSTDGTVVLLRAFDRDDYSDVAGKLNVDPDSETTPDDVARRVGLLADAARRLDARGIDVVVRGALGEASDAILRTSREDGADLVVVGGRRRSPAGKLLFGSTAQRVMMNADCPVTFVKESARDEDAPARRAVEA
jgi:nucleotide-binding universal stress UspA family protein